MSDAVAAPSKTASRWRRWLWVLARRLFDLLVLILVVTTVLFFLLRLIGDPATVLVGVDATPEQLEAVRVAYGLDKPLPIQFASFLSEIVSGNFGYSLATGQPALGLVFESLAATLSLAVLSLVVAFSVAVVVGAWLGAGAPGFARRLVAGVIFVLQGTPGFVAGLLLIQVFAVEWPVLPSLGLDGWQSYVLPAATLSLFLMPKQARLIAANVRQVYAADYIRTARAIGAPPAAILFRHALPNALIGAVALLGAQAALLLSGAVVTESIFGWPGLGSLLLSAAQILDFPVIQALAIVVALLVFAANSLANLLVVAIDPRIRDGLQTR